ncbi:hypothetical protein LPB16_22525 (plasmid) [Salmonella enterica subsp. enterica]
MGCAGRVDLPLPSADSRRRAGGTTAGAFLGEHWGVAALALTGLFVLAVTRLLRAFRGGS